VRTSRLGLEPRSRHSLARWRRFFPRWTHAVAILSLRALFCLAPSPSAPGTVISRSLSKNGVDHMSSDSSILIYAILRVQHRDQTLNIHKLI